LNRKAEAMETKTKAMSTEQIRERVLEILRAREKVYLTEFPALIPEIKGEKAMYMPMKPGFNPNVLWLGMVSEQFIEVFNQLMTGEQVIGWEPETRMWMLLADSAPIYSDIPLATVSRVKKGKNECWLPIRIFIAEDPITGVNAFWDKKKALDKTEQQTP
jgi:hypothetical protein